MILNWKMLAAHALATSLVLSGLEPIYAQLGREYQEQKSKEEEKQNLCISMYNAAQFATTADTTRYLVIRTEGYVASVEYFKETGYCRYDLAGSLSIVKDESGRETQWQIEGGKLVMYWKTYVSSTGERKIWRYEKGTLREGVPIQAISAY